MRKDFKSVYEELFRKFSEYFFSELAEGEVAGLNLGAEDTSFVRFTQAMVRQNTKVEQGNVKLTLQKNGRTAIFSFPFSEDHNQNMTNGLKVLELCRKDIASLPEDPFLVPLSNHGQIRDIHTGDLLPAENPLDSLLGAAKSYDMAGILTSGSVIRANSNSMGQFHWFATSSFYVDYSLYSPEQKAVKDIYSAKSWEQTEWESRLKKSGEQLALLRRPAKSLERGKYRTFLGSMAVAETLEMLSWGGLSQSAMRQGHGVFNDLYNGKKKLSSKITLREDFSLGHTQRFNSFGELAPETLTLIEAGEGNQLLTSSRTAKEYGGESNGAEVTEGARSISLNGGTLKEEDVLKEIGTGLYLNNLHYLNFSDRQNARITGMTRYACFWVEGGEIQGPIADMRFDDSYYNFWGSNLVDLTAKVDTIPTLYTYGHRSIGATVCPGMLVNDFQLTL